MSILLRVLAVAFAALCVWLVVRIANRRERWAKRTLAAIIAFPVIYVASFPPACWLCDRDLLPLKLVSAAYRPLTYASLNSGQELSLLRYGKLLERREARLLENQCNALVPDDSAAAMVVVEATVQRLIEKHYSTHER